MAFWEVEVGEDGVLFKICYNMFHLVTCLSNLGSFITGFGYGSGCTSLTSLTVSVWVDEVGIQGA